MDAGRSIAFSVKPQGPFSRRAKGRNIILIILQAKAKRRQ
jgi:hypothetical protein